MSIKQIREGVFHLYGKDFSYLFSAEKFGYLHHQYYGAKLPTDADLSHLYVPTVSNDYTAQIDGSAHRYSSISPEYPIANYGEFRDHAISVEDYRGVPVTDLRYASARILPQKPVHADGIPVARGGETLEVTLLDEVLGLSVKLLYTVYEEENILTRRTVIENKSAHPIVLTRALSASVDFEGHDFTLMTLHGGHYIERTMQKSALGFGKFSIGNSRGNSSHQNSPFMALLCPGCVEESGRAYGLSLLYSGSHYESAEVDQHGRTRILSGIQPDTFRWHLEPGASFDTPEAALCYSGGGLGQMSRSYHDFYRNYVINPHFVHRPRPVVLNSWEGMHFHFDNKRLMDAIDAIKDSKIDTFVLDDGWFGVRNNATSGLGDWYVNTDKLPGGLAEISEHCHKRGMKFGLWIEPEMINPDSDLYRAHPDWVITAPDRPHVVARNQCILDLSRREVLDHIKAAMHRVIGESGADYIKWDCNRHMTENWSAALPAHRQGELQHRFVLGVYELARYLTESFPEVLFEGCSGGGGRFDGAMLAFFPQYWTSDNTDVHDRTVIQYGTGIAFPLSTHSCHVSASPNIRNGRPSSVRARTNVARQGVLGYEFDPLHVGSDELAAIAENITAYRATESLVLEGDLYRGENTVESSVMTQTVVSKDKSHAMMICYRAMKYLTPTVPILRAGGLDPHRIYHINELDRDLPGSVLMHAGIPITTLEGDFDAVLYTLRALN